LHLNSAPINQFIDRQAAIGMLQDLTAASLLLVALFCPPLFPHFYATLAVVSGLIAAITVVTLVIGDYQHDSNCVGLLGRTNVGWALFAFLIPLLYPVMAPENLASIDRGDALLAIAVAQVAAFTAYGCVSVALSPFHKHKT
jgi:hypothetical protein